MFAVLQPRPRVGAVSRWLAVAASLAGALLSGCTGGTTSPGDFISNLSGPSQPPAQPAAPIGLGSVKVALILPSSASGNAAVAAQSMRNAAEMALAEFKGPDVQLLVKDDAGSAQGAQAAAQQALDEGAEIILDQKLKMQLATSHAIVCAAKAVELVHAAAGTSSIRNEYQFQRYFRDVHTITQHAFASASRYESVGALMLGAESDWGFFDF